MWPWVKWRKKDVWKKQEERLKKKFAMVVSCLVFGVSVFSMAAKKDVKTSDVFYVYSDKGNPGNHYIPSGWMGDYSDLKLNDGSTENCADGKTCIQWTYSAKGTQGARWTGAYWQHPPNNWGNRPGGFDLTGYKRLTFWARGAKGGERIAEFKVGGITGEFGDSDAVNIGPIELESDWKKYTIDVSQADLSKIIGGFCWAASADDNPDGFVIYLDEIRFER
jgi:hypothetical protein